MQKKLIWTLPARIIHALFVLLFALAWLTSDSDILVKIHIGIGLTLAWLATLRIVLGFVGGGYLRFSTFPFGLSALKNYFLTLFKPHNYGGHNPASAWSALFIMLGILATGASGLLAYLYSSHDLKELHEFFAYATTAVVVAHIAGAILSAKVSGAHAVTCMVTGRKKTDDEEAKHSKIQKSIATVGVLLTPIAALYAWQFVGANEQKIMEASKARLPNEYVKECSSCHSLYPTSYLSANSWGKIFDNLDKHFGEDASLDDALTNSLKKYVMDNAGPDKNSKFSRYASAENGIEITKTKAWKKKHEEIPKEIFEQKKFRPSNCVACHKDADYGIIRAANINLDELGSMQKIKVYEALMCD